MRKTRVKILWEELTQFIKSPTNQQWRVWKKKYKDGYLGRKA